LAKTRNSNQQNNNNNTTYYKEDRSQHPIRLPQDFKMQRIVSGEGIHGLKASSDLPANNDTSDDVMMSHSPSVAFGDAAATTNFVENEDGYHAEDDGGGMTDSHETITTFAQQQEGLVYQRQNTVSPTGNERREFIAPPTQQQQQQQTPLSIISGLLPAVGLIPISRNDSRNSGISFGSGLQRSHNSSRDWGWFEDVHHSDQSVNGSFTNSARRNKNDGASSSIAPLGSNRTSLPQHHLASTRTSNLANAGGIGVNETGGVSSAGGDSRMSSNDDYGIHRDTGDSSGDSRNNSNNRLPRDRGKTSNTASLLPTGNEILVDDSQEYLEPILINQKPRDIENEAAVQAVTAPNYVLEESLSDQLLWKETAGNRPPQPVEVRAFFEAQWAENFAQSEVKYQMPTEVLTATTPVSLNPFADGNFGTDSIEVIGAGTPVAAGSRSGGGDHHNVADIVSSFVVPGGSGHGVSSHQNSHLRNKHQVVRNNSGSGGNLIVYAKGDNVFGTTVSKSFPRPSINGELVSGVDTINISIASYRVVESESRGKHAQFHVIYREGSIRDTTGVWKRYSDFQELSKKVTKVHEGCASVIANMSPLAITEEHDVEHLPNAITSWHLLKKRKRWYRCLDSGYLSLKAFLLERFLHDILFESSTPDLLRDFVGIPPPR